MITNKLLLSVSVIAVLVSSALFAAVPAVPRASAQQQIPGRNWEWSWYDGHGTNYSPQTQITKENVNLLEMKWIYPFPVVLTGGSGAGGGAAQEVGGRLILPTISQVGQGFQAQPIIVNGIIYTASQIGDVFAFDAVTGKEIWRVRPEIKTPPNLGPKHMHTINYFDGKLYVPVNINGWGDVMVLDALTGKEVSRIADIQNNVPGTRYPESDRYTVASEFAPSLYRKGNVLLVMSTAIDFISRNFVAGYDAATGKLLWRWYVIPPAPDCKWEPKQANDARKGNINPALAVGDWGTRCDLNGAGGPWGHIAVDEEKGVVYFGTTDPYPTTNATHRPGPTLYTNSIIALDAMTGEMKWYNQVFPHHLAQNSELKEGTLLIKGATVKGEKKDLVVQSGRGIGPPYVLDADTGKIIYSYDRWERKATGANPRKVPATCENMGNECDMKRPWYNYPNTGPHELFYGNGGVVAYDPKTNAIFFYSETIASRLRPIQVDVLPKPPFFPKGEVLIQDPAFRAKYPVIAEFVAMDLNTGQVKWKLESPREWAPSPRGPVVTAGMVCGGATDGIMRCLDTETGKELWRRSLGVSIPMPPTIGATADGKMRMVGLFGGIGGGGLVVFGLPDKLPEPQVITKEVVKEVPKEVIKEVVKEVPKEVVKEVPKEVIKEVVRTETKTVTVETISPISYAMIGVGIVIAVVGVVLSRRKKV